MLNKKRQNVISCQEAKLLMVPIWSGELGVSDEEERSFKAHLIVCQECNKEYDEIRRLMSLVKNHWGSISKETQKLLEQAGHENVEQNHVQTNDYQPITVEQGWKDLCHRCPELAEKTRPTKSLQLFRNIGAFAACLVFGIIIWMVFSNYSKPHFFSKDTSSQQAAFAPTSSVNVELLTPSGYISVDTENAIFADNELKTLRINGNRQMVLNAGTLLTIQPYNLGCMVKLNKGRIYTKVEHDGKPFIVVTLHGRAIITGTTFDIKVGKDSTSLIVAEGTVKFESDKGTVDVKAGQQSLVYANSSPLSPSLCDPAKLTAWATGSKAEHIPALNESFAKACKLPIPESGTLKLDKINYESWVQEKQSWFKREFPEIFKLKECLSNEGIQVDYPELLLKSGLVWQFNYPDDKNGRIAIFNYKSLEKAAASYGYDKCWLEKNVSSAIFSSQARNTSPSKTNLLTLENWLKSISGKTELDDQTLLSSWHAAVYLIETRSLAWLAVKKRMYDLTEQQQNEILDILQKQVDIACDSERFIKKLYQTDPPVELCRQVEYQKMLDGLAENIKMIRFFEEKISKLSPLIWA